MGVLIMMKANLEGLKDWGTTFFSAARVSTSSSDRRHEATAFALVPNFKLRKCVSALVC